MSRIWSGKYKNAVQVSHNLSATSQVKVSAETVQRVFRSAGLRGRAKLKTHCCQKGIKSCVSHFAKCYKDSNYNGWKKVIWSDETKINCLGSDGRERTWKNKNMKLRSQHVKPALKFGSSSIMVWGCMTTNGIGGLVRTEVRMTSDSYIDIVSKH